MAELLVGIEILPTGRKRDRLKSALTASLSHLFEDRILCFDQHAAASYASAVAWTRSHGMTIGVADGQIAAIALVHGFAVATRDAAPFIAAGVAVIDPWAA